jgi:cellobiose phosphorylase
MSRASNHRFVTSKRDDLPLSAVASAGLRASLLPSGALFSFEHVEGHRRVMISQTLASPVGDGMARLFLRIAGADGPSRSLIGAREGLRVGAGDDRIVWEGETDGLAHRATLWLHPSLNVWLWRVEIVNRRDAPASCDAVLVQDLGLGDPGFLMNNEAYACQYMDHHVARHARLGPVLMSRQAQAQGGAFPWAAHGCLEEAVGFATDYRQIVGPQGRDADGLLIGFGEALPSRRLQWETACAALQSPAATLEPGQRLRWTFFGAYLPDHPAASSDADLALVDEVERAARDYWDVDVALAPSEPGLPALAPVAVAERLDAKAVAARHRRRIHVERGEAADGEEALLSYFAPGRGHARHVVAGDKDRLTPRRHGAVLRSGDAMALDDDLLCATTWMHGVFAAQLSIGNTTFHKLFSVSRDPYNVTRANGLRMLVEIDGAWRHLATPSTFEMGLNDCRWIYKLGKRVITVSATAAGDAPAMQWRVTIKGRPCRLLIFGQLVLGEREYLHAGRVEIDARRVRATFRPDPEDRWARAYPDAAMHLVTSTPRRVEAIGGDELLYADGRARAGGYIAIRTKPVAEFAFAVVGSMTDVKQAAALADAYARPVDEAAMLKPADRFWRKLTRGARVRSKKADADALALDTILPWLAHDAMIHLTVPHGLEQYTGGAWGTRDVCQGPIEALLALEHDAAAKDILRIVFAQQYEGEGDWPQWFMLEPYSEIQAHDSHGDVIIWPLKALCDYIEATGDFAFLDEPVAWRRESDLRRTDAAEPITAHVDKLFATIQSRYVQGTHLIRYGNGDWNDSLQPVDPDKRDWMVSSWTVALLYEQARRYAEILRRAGRAKRARDFDTAAAAMRADLRKHLVRDGVIAGYGVFSPQGGAPQLLLHPHDALTGLHYSLLPLTQGVIGGLFTKAEAKKSEALIRKHLLFADGARLTEKPLVYRGGVETMFRRAESAAFFGREIGLMYTHSHLRYAGALGALGAAQGLWDALMVSHPIAVTDRLANASPRQRNAYFSSSDAAFPDRYAASAEWGRVAAQTIPVDGGWRVYSSGPGIFLSMVICDVFGRRRVFGERVVEPGLPPSHRGVTLDWPRALSPTKRRRR